jgi:chemotaxis protein CheD
MMTTMLGSCIAACMCDRVARVGGMNHFLLPKANGTDSAVSLRYGAYAMELLINGLTSIGAKRDRLEAKLFGGGRLTEGLTDIGEKNTAFAEQFLRREGIPLVGGSTRGTHARRIQFWPATGRARQLALAIAPEMVARPIPQPAAAADHGSVEFF